MQFSIRRLLICTTLIALAIWFVRSAYLGGTQIEMGESLESVQWLPESASKVSYYRSNMNTAYEFDIDEAEFQKWSRWELSEIKEPVSIARYLSFSAPSPQRQTNSTEEEMKAFIAEYSRRVITIHDGLYYGQVQGNGGGVWVGYDRRTGRAYYQSAPR